MTLLQYALSIYHYCPMAVSVVGLLYAVSVLSFRAVTFESDGVIATIVTLTKAAVFIPISWLFLSHPALKYREVRGIFDNVLNFIHFKAHLPFNPSNFSNVNANF